MKIAVLISGEYRTFSVCRKTMTFLDDPRVDIYFSTWNTSVYCVPIINFYKKEYITETQILSDLGKQAVIEIEDENSIGVKKYNTKLIHRWIKGFELIKNSGVEYDYVLIVRPDTFFNNTNTSLDTIETYSDVVGVTLSDQLLVSSYKKIKEIFDNLTTDSWVNAKEKNWHIWWDNFMIKHSPIDAKEWNYVIICRVWANDNHTFEDIVEMHYDWRDLILTHEYRVLRWAFWPKEIIDNAGRRWDTGLLNKYKLQ